MSPEGGRLAENVGRFVRALRAAGMPVGAEAAADALKALDTVGLASREDAFWALHAVLVRRREHMALFAQAFALFFRAPAAPGLPPEAAGAGGEAISRRVAEALADTLRADVTAERAEERDARLTMSEREVLASKDFAEMSAAELAEIERRVDALALPRTLVRTRRLAPDPRGPRFDPRATIRTMLRPGGMLVPPRLRASRLRPAPVVAIVDISGSMAPYTPILLRFLHALGRRRRVHVLLFGTRLTNVSRALAVRDPDEALRRCAAAVADWSGGTRIASSLRRFNKDWSRRLLGQGAITLLVTDGLERDPDGGLAAETDRLRRSSRRLIWLNPLLRFAGFEARAAGIRAILPHVDAFRPVHSLDSIAELVRALDFEDAAGDQRAYLKAAQLKRAS